jgi:hypothetical protein
MKNQRAFCRMHPLKGVPGKAPAFFASFSHESPIRVAGAERVLAVLGGEAECSATLSGCEANALPQVLATAP